VSACEKLHLFADGELPDEEVPVFQRHLAECASCQTELRDVMVLDALASELRPPRTQELPAQTHPARAAARLARRRVWAWPAGLAAAAAIAVFAVLGLRGSGDPLGELAAEPDRPFAERLAYPGADRHRPHRVMRGATETHALPLPALARMEDAGDFEGLAVAYLLAGDDAQAEKFLARAPRSPSVDVEAAVLAMHRRRWDEARVLLEGVLVTSPHHPQALWNLALVRRQLGDQAGATAAFRAVAALGEPGWSDEATLRAGQSQQ
jgi:hypothetical protein